MRNIFLKFASEEEANAILFDEDKNPIWQNTDVIGILYEDEETILEGYHVNLAADECPEELVSYQVFPKSPRRVFGGIE